MAGICQILRTELHTQDLSYDKHAFCIIHSLFYNHLYEFLPFFEAFIVMVKYRSKQHTPFGTHTVLTLMFVAIILFFHIAWLGIHCTFNCCCGTTIVFDVTTLILHYSQSNQVANSSADAIEVDQLCAPCLTSHFR